MKLVYIKTDHEACLAWVSTYLLLFDSSVLYRPGLTRGQVTKPFELYMCVSSQLPKSAVVAAANTVVRWVGSEESKIFLKDAPVF